MRQLTIFFEIIENCLRFLGKQQYILIKGKVNFGFEVGNYFLLSGISDENIIKWERGKIFYGSDMWDFSVFDEGAKDLLRIQIPYLL